GMTVVSVTVTALDGTKKTYQILANRAEDPESTTLPNENAGAKTLAELSVDGGIISPAFNSEKYDYYLIMPLGTQRITVNAVPTDPQAQVNISGNTRLNMGTNLVTVRVTAGDESVQEYKITVQVGDTVPKTTEIPDDIFIPELPAPPEVPPEQNAEAGGGDFAWWWLAIAGGGGIGIGILLEHFVLPAFDKKRQF
ncbi:MAG: cadherin-like beta sandwich domain-containing protein, partial [Oscillospiraceae bacterium]|nr:cadherin-like beta sandwich domain-containing protein [Oscillospiraceae bacterium]